MQLHQIQRNQSNRRSRQIGRGGKRGTTAGRGTKGQKARAGHKLRPQWRDELKKLPKLRGYRFHSFQTKALPLNLSALEKVFVAGDTVNPASLLAKKLVNKKSGRLPTIKILATGAITKNLVIDGCLVSDAARVKLEQAGGRVAGRSDES